MTFSARTIFFTGAMIFAFWQLAISQDIRRDLNLREGGTIEIVNKNGRVTVKTESDDFSLSASSTNSVSDSEVKISGADGRMVITVAASDKQKRIDITLKVPERSNLKIETTAGAIDVAGNLALIQAKTDTGTISVDIPIEDVSYQLQWIESRPRYLADFEIAAVKEKSAGRFEIKGHLKEEAVKRDSTDESRSSLELPDSELPNPNAKETNSKSKTERSKAVSLSLTTSRGIVLLNVPPGEVMSDLRERPLTNAAKAIIRSGDSLLMEAIRRAAPKYFGDYAKTLPPLRLEPSFAAKAAKPDGPNASMKTAVVRVTDLSNRSIGGLFDDDFEITENGTVREIMSVERSNAPFNLVLLLDVSGSVENYVNFIRKAARTFVDTVGSEDRVAIVIFNDDVKLLSTFTTDKGKLSTSLDTFDAGGSTAYYDALAFTIADVLRPLKGERTAVVILTDGDDNRSFLAFDSLMGSIQESGALIYPLYVPSGLIALGEQKMNTDIDPLRKKYMSLTAKSEGEGDKLAKISGGVYYPITQIGQIQKAYEDIVIQMRSAYEITFRSEIEISGNGASPRLKIRVKRENLFPTVTSVTVARPH